MSELKPPVGGTDFKPHPTGAYTATCADVYLKEVNGQYGLKTKAVIVFHTSHVVEIQGKPKAAQVHAMMNFTWGTATKPSSLRLFIKSWFPSATDAQVEAMDLEKLIGQKAYITVTHNGNYANVSAVMPKPPTLPAPVISADYIRHKDRPVQAPAAAPVSQQGPPDFDPNEEGPPPFDHIALDGIQDEVPF